jgi:hypothetical protein
VSILEWHILVQAPAFRRDFTPFLIDGRCSTNRSDFYTDGTAVVAQATRNPISSRI